jgi:hypothetical protein
MRRYDVLTTRPRRRGSCGRASTVYWWCPGLDRSRFDSEHPSTDVCGQYVHIVHRWRVLLALALASLTLEFIRKVWQRWSRVVAFTRVSPSSGVVAQRACPGLTQLLSSRAATYASGSRGLCHSAGSCELNAARIAAKRRTRAGCRPSRRERFSADAPTTRDLHRDLRRGGSLCLIRPSGFDSSERVLRSIHDLGVVGKSPVRLVVHLVVARGRRPAPRPPRRQRQPLVPTRPPGADPPRLAGRSRQRAALARSPVRRPLARSRPVGAPWPGTSPGAASSAVSSQSAE